MRYSMTVVLALAGALLAAEPRPPWTPQYKIRPGEKDRLTPADVVGPDGIVYPNWTRCGVRGGIPTVPERARIEDFGGRPDDGKDDAPAIEAACRAVAAKGGGAVVLAAGTYRLDRPVTIRADGVVLRGAGRDKTRILFTYAVPSHGRFYWPPAGSRVARDTRIELHCPPKKLSAMTIFAGSRALHRWKRSKHSGNTFSTATRGSALVGKVSAGPVELRGEALYQDGSKRSCTMRVVFDPTGTDSRPTPSSRGAIHFLGRGQAGSKNPLARDGRRGQTTLTLKTAEGLAGGDVLLLDAPSTARWKTLTRNACKWGIYRRTIVRVETVAGRTITIAQPLRIEFPVVDGSYVRKFVPIRRCGVEDLSIRQTENLWITTVLLEHAWQCWARNVTVRMCGRFPVYGRLAKQCEIRDCVFDDAHFKGGGGTAYAGWEHSYDCLIDGIETFKFRHAPCVQWSASGCVIRRGVFHDSDAQWHSGWTNENLFEQCVVASARGHRGYGYGAWASPPGDTAHGPNGPRNVVYACDFSSQRTGLWMGGMNENWLILHNRFVVGKGPGVFATTCSFDHILRGNVFVLRDGRSPMVQLATDDCTGVEIVSNALHGGNGKFLTGRARPAKLEANTAHVLGQQLPARPKPPVASIYEWQRVHATGR